MTFIGSLCIMLAFAALILMLGVLALHFSVPGGFRRGLWQTFWCAVVLGDRDALLERRPVEADTLATVSPGL